MAAVVLSMAAVVPLIVLGPSVATMTPVGMLVIVTGILIVRRTTAVPSPGRVLTAVLIGLVVGMVFGAAVLLAAGGMA